MTVSTRIDALIKAQLTNNRTLDERLDAVVNALSKDELRELVRPLAYDRYMMQIRRDVVAVQYPSIVPYHRELRIIPRDAAGQQERMTVRDAEKRALCDMERATTDAQRVAALVFLKQHVISLGDGTDVPWHEATRDQRNERISLLTRQMSGLSDSRKLLDRANSTCLSLGVETIAEAEAQVNKPLVATP